MESDWRWNVPELGWALGPYRMIARFRSSIGIFEEFIAQPFPGTGALNGLIRPVGSSIIPVPLLSFPAVGSFPYGYDVDPD